MGEYDLKENIKYLIVVLCLAMVTVESKPIEGSTECQNMSFDDYLQGVEHLNFFKSNALYTPSRFWKLDSASKTSRSVFPAVTDAEAESLRKQRSKLVGNGIFLKRVFSTLDPTTDTIKQELERIQYSNQSMSLTPQEQAKLDQNAEIRKILRDLNMKSLADLANRIAKDLQTVHNHPEMKRVREGYFKTDFRTLDEQRDGANKVSDKRFELLVKMDPSYRGLIKMIRTPSVRYPGESAAWSVFMGASNDLTPDLATSKKVTIQSKKITSQAQLRVVKGASGLIAQTGAQAGTRSALKIIERNRALAEWTNCTGKSTQEKNRNIPAASLQSGYISLDEKCTPVLSVFGQDYLKGDLLEHTKSASSEDALQAGYSQLLLDPMLCQAFITSVETQLAKVKQLKKETLEPICQDDKIILSQRDDTCQMTYRTTLLKNDQGEIVGHGSFVPTEIASGKSADFLIPLGKTTVQMGSVITNDFSMNTAYPSTKKLTDTVHFSDPTSFFENQDLDTNCKVLRKSDDLKLPNTFEKKNAIGHQAMLIKMSALDGIQKCWNDSASSRKSKASSETHTQK